MFHCVRTRRLAMLTALCGLIVVAACSDDECSPGATECISDSLIRTCVPGPDGNAWLVSQCGASYSCLSDPSLVIRDDDEDDAGVRRGPKGKVASTQPACVGCSVGAHECLSGALARYCVSGGIWQLDACAVGETCSETSGVCSVSSGADAVHACKPGATACASARVAKVCDADGTAWVEQTCAGNERCVEDHCQPDPSASCDKGDSCLDNKTAVRCLSRAEGYKLEKCTGDLYCDDGRCRGAVCAVGSSCIGSNQVRECVNGSSYRDSQCGVNEICMQDKDTAKCVPLQCKLGTSSCGDPRDASLDKRKYFTACVKGDGSGIPEWVRGECTGQSSCDPSLAQTANPCSQECTKGAERCASDAISGINDGVQKCGDDGKWGAITSCNTGKDARLQCAIASTPDASALPRAVCAEPVCYFALNNPNTGARGTCDGEKIRDCKPDGTLGDAHSCDQGFCHVVRDDATADGHKPGACTATQQCKDSEAMCVNAGGGVATPRYRTCTNGVWSVELQTCKNDALCYTGRDDKGLRRTLCGAQCSPGSRRCNSDGALEVCDDTGHFANATFCDKGVCRQLDNQDAACVLECMPGTHVCAGEWANLAGDGIHKGYSAQRTCSADGRLGEPVMCASGQVCRLSGANTDLGCLECIGPKVPGGNEEGTADSRCEPGNDKNVQECSADNTWTAGRACAGSRMCVKPVLGTCGICRIAATGKDIVCTQSNVAANLSGATCESLDFGAPSPWGGVSDCCAKYKQDSENASSFAYCK